MVKVSRAQRRAAVVPTTWEAESGGSLEPLEFRAAWATE
jgi:hypothetical protein